MNEADNRRTSHAPADNFFWYAFLVWTLIGALVMPFGIGESTVRRMIASDVMADAIAMVLRPADAIWMVLAFGVVYLHVARERGLAVARMWGLVILLGSGAIEAVGALTGWPFGPYHYTDNLGLRLFGVLPFTIPLAWFVIVATAHCAIQALRPAWARWRQALAVGAVATLTDLNLEFIAWKARAYWIWYPPGSEQAADPPAWPPLQNYVSWFAVAFVLSLALTGGRAVRSAGGATSPRFPLRPVVVLGLMNALFLLVHLARWLGLS